MATIQPQKNNLADINNLKDLEKEIRMVRARIKKREQALGERWKQVPGEAFKAGVGTVLPFFLNNKVAGSTWNLIKDAAGFILGKKGSENGQGRLKTVWRDARKLGIFALLKGVFGVLKKKSS